MNIDADTVHRLRVVHVIGGLGLGGAEALLYRLATRDSAVVHEVICLGGRGWYSDKLEHDRIRVEHLGISRITSLPLGLVRLYRLLKQRNADVVQTWLYSSNLLAGAAARLAGIPVVWGIHCESPQPYGPVQRLLGRAGGMAARWIPQFVVSCSAAAAAGHAKLGYGAARGGVITNGYDPQAFQPDEAARAQTRAALAIASTAFLVGSISRWIDYKDIPTLLRAVKLCADQGLPLQCILVGHRLGADNDRLMNSIEESGCADLIIPLGKRSDVRELARAMDLHVLSSTTESFGNTIAETMLSGTPNVVTDCGGPPAVVGETGWVVQPRDPERLATAIETAWHERKDEPEEWQARRRAARARIAEHFSFNSMAASYEDVWQQVSHRTDAESRHPDAGTARSANA